jgi:hypothetical protein
LLMEDGRPARLAANMGEDAHAPLNKENGRPRGRPLSR